MKTIILSVPAAPSSLNNITMVMVGVFLLCAVIALIMFFARQRRKKNSKPVIKFKDWQKKNNKAVNFIILLIVSLSLTSTVSAKETLIVKKNKTVYFFQIENNNEPNMFIISDVFVNPTVSDLVTLETPEAAWNIINRVKDGIFDTRINKLEEQLASTKEENKKLIKENDEMTPIMIIEGVAILALACIALITGMCWRDDSKKLARLSRDSQ
jgi:hypothetical protein